MIPNDRKRKALESIANGGVLTVDAIIAAARDPGHVLHPLFQWEAAQERWREVARSIIREVTITVTVWRGEKLQ